jgi:hypothetical protein
MEMMAIAASICSVEFQILNQLMVGSQKDNDGAERDCLGQTGCAFSFQLPSCGERRTQSPAVPAATSHPGTCR